MIKTREQLRAEADASVAEFAELIASQQETSGIPKPPKIEVSEISLDVKPFDFGIIEEPATEVFEGPIPEGEPTGACCVGTDCTIETESDCTGMGGTYQGDDTVCDPNPCTLCPTNVRVTICWHSFFDPEVLDCQILINEQIDIALTAIECPIDFSTSGAKIQSYVGDVTAIATGDDCPDVTDANFGTGGIALVWDAVGMEWTIASSLTFPNIPATFSYGPSTVPFEDLVAAGPIIVESDTCPGIVPGLYANIILEFS